MSLRGKVQLEGKPLCSVLYGDELLPSFLPLPSLCQRLASYVALPVSPSRAAAAALHLVLGA